MKKLNYVIALFSVASLGLSFACSSDQESDGSGSRYVEVYDYKPHYACSGAGRENAVDWVERVLRSSDADGPPDFFAISQLENQSINLPENFQALGAFCDHSGSEAYADVIGLLYDVDTWTLTGSFPIDESGNTCPLTDDSSPPATCVWGESTPCCACAGDPQSTPIPDGHSIGPRAFAIGRFQDQAANELCVVTANLPHPVTAEDQRSCDLNLPIDCLSNIDNTGPFGTENFIRQLSALCGDVAQVIFLGDTNATNPYWDLAQMFPAGVMSEMIEQDDPLYTCCFDEDPIVGSVLVNQYPTDRIGARGARSVVTTGGAAIPGVSMSAPTVYDLDSCHSSSYGQSYGFPCCGSSEEHAPLRSVIDFGY